MKNRIVVTLLSFVMLLTACKKQDPKPTIDSSYGPKVSMEKITNTNQLVEGSNDTVFFKVKLSEPYKPVFGDHPVMKVLIVFGDTMGVVGQNLFVYDQSGTVDPTYDYFKVALRGDPYKPLYNYYSVNFYEGESEHIVGLKPQENSVYEKDKKYVFSIPMAIYPHFGGYYVDWYSLQISYDYIDNDPMPVIGFDHGIQTSMQVQETAGSNQSIRIKTTNKSGFLMPVYYSVSGTATSGVDYIIKSPNPFIITPEDFYYDLSFDVINDNVVEGTESFTIKLLSADKALIGTPTNNSIFLRDSIQIFIQE